MGVDYFDCNFCGECIPDCAYVSVCEYCAENLKNDGYIEVVPIEPDWGYLIKNLDTKRITYYENWSDQITHVYGFWKTAPQYLKQRFKDALIGTNNFGGMNEKDVRELCQKIKRMRGEVG